MSSGFYCHTCGDTGNSAYAGNAKPCPCLLGVTRAEWCQRVVRHRSQQGKAMRAWVVDEWLTGKLNAQIVTQREFEAIAGIVAARQMTLWEMI